MFVFFTLSTYFLLFLCQLTAIIRSFSYIITTINFLFHKSVFTLIYFASWVLATFQWIVELCCTEKCMCWNSIWGKTSISIALTDSTIWKTAFYPNWHIHLDYYLARRNTPSWKGAVSVQKFNRWQKVSGKEGMNWSFHSRFSGTHMRFNFLVCVISSLLVANHGRISKCMQTNAF